MSSSCEKLHVLFNSMQRFSFPFDELNIPLNGIYILFEKTEKSHRTDRIVRVGTHTGKNQLRSRLKQHFLNQNKDRSIFRKNIGRAILNKKKDPFLRFWELDLTTKANREKYSELVDFEKQKQTEKKVSEYIQQNFSFVVFEVNEKDERLEMESKILSTVSHCRDCKPSQNWLGRFSPKEKIRSSGLWNVNELYKQELSDEEVENLKLK